MKIYLNDKVVLFRCDRKKCKHCNSMCNHTTDISHAIFDGEKSFEDVCDYAVMETNK